MNVSKPTDKQLEWYDKELGVIIHYCMEIYDPTFKDFKNDGVRIRLSPDKITPKKLEPRQWVKSAAEMGAKYAVLVANHCTGFSLWPTKVNDYCTRSLEWRGGKGDIVQEFIDACEEFDIKPGLYYSTGCNGYYNINDNEPQEYTADYYKEYVKRVEEQLTELWTNYGELFEIWFDGGIVPVEKGGPDVEKLLKMYQPNAICFQGPKSHVHNVRWVGTEEGLAPKECWATTNAGDVGYDGTVKHEEAGMGDPEGKYFWPAETDTPNREQRAYRGGWMWAEGQEDLIRSPEDLLQCYIRSVGRNSNLLLGMAISSDGNFQDEEQFIALGKLLKEHFGEPLVVKKEIDNNEVSLTVPEGKEARYIVLREDIADGQRIRNFRVLVDGKEVYSGECIGHKRIIPMRIASGNTVSVVFEKALEGWKMRDIALY